MTKPFRPGVAQHLAAIRKYFQDKSHIKPPRFHKCPHCGVWHQRTNECPFCHTPYNKQKKNMED